MAFKELLMILGAYFHNNEDVVIPANIYGKISTLVFYASGFIMLELTIGMLLMNLLFY